MHVELSLPPLFRGEAAPNGVDPFAQAVSIAALGCDPGLIVHNSGGTELSAALVLAPDAPLEDAMAMVFAAALGFSDALGALAPPEIAVHFEWPGVLRINGARCGGFRAAAASGDPEEAPDWLVVGFNLPIMLPDGAEPGADPEKTVLHEEGCVDVDPFRLLESWSRHALVWINTWLDDGMTRLHAEWRSRAHGLGEAVDFSLGGENHKGTFVGIDERGGMLLRDGSETRLIPLSAMLE